MTKAQPISLQRFIPKLTPRFTEPTHLAPLTDVIERIRAGEVVECGVSVPPRHEKTETLKHAIALLLLERPSLRIGLVQYSQTAVEKRSREVKELYLRAGGKLNPDASSRKDWRTGVHDGGVWATSPGGPITGEGFDVIVIDDPVKDRATAESAVERDKLWAWYTNVTDFSFTGCSGGTGLMSTGNAVGGVNALGASWGMNGTGAGGTKTSSGAALGAGIVGTGGLGSNTGVAGFGAGTGAGVTGTGASAFNALGGLFTGSGTQAGISATGGNGSGLFAGAGGAFQGGTNGNGVQGFAGSAGLAGVYGQGNSGSGGVGGTFLGTQSFAGVNGLGGATGPGGTFTGGTGAGFALIATGGGSSCVAGSFTATGNASGINSGGAGNGDGGDFAGGTGTGVGVFGQGGSATGGGGSFGQQGAGGYFLGLGTNANGIVARGGSGNGDGIVAYGGSTGAGVVGLGGLTSGVGGSFVAQGGNSAGLNASGFGNGNGANFTGGSNGAGVNATAGSSSNDSIVGNAGPIFPNYAVPSLTTPSANRLYKDNVPKSWGSVSTNGAGGSTVNAYFNSSTIVGLTSTLIQVAFAQPMASANYSVTANAESIGLGPLIVGVGAKTSTGFSIAITNPTGPAAVNPLTTALTCDWQVHGQQ